MGESDGVLDGVEDLVEDGDVVSAGHGAEEDAAAVEVVDFRGSEGLVVERRAGREVRDGEGEGAAEPHIVGHFGDGGDGAGFVIDDEQEDGGLVLGPHLFGFAGGGPGVEGELRIEEGDLGGLQGGDSDLAAPGGEAGGAAEEDLVEHGC